MSITDQEFAEMLASNPWLRIRASRRFLEPLVQPSAAVTPPDRELPVTPKAEKRGTGKQSKYRNIKTEIDGIVFDSKGESRRYGELKIMFRAGMIRNLELQVEFELTRTPLKMSYISDFTYYEKRMRTRTEFYWQYVVEDFKSDGTRTREYRRKRKAMKTVFGIEIRETGLIR